MSAVLDPPVLAKPDTSDLFMCRRSDLRLTRVPRYPVRGPGGEKVGERTGQTVVFAHGVLRVPHEGDMTLEDGQRVPAQEIREWLLSHRLHGDLQEGFWRVDPVAPPVSQDEMQSLMRAAMRLDVDGLREIIKAERAGWNRDQIIDSALESVEEIEAALAAQTEKPDKSKPKQ